MNYGQLGHDRVEDGLQQVFSTSADIIDKLTEAQIQQELLLRNPPTGTRPSA